MESLSLEGLLAGYKRKSLRFSEFMEGVAKNPGKYLHTSSSLISDAIKYFGFEIVVRSGEPVISYNIFRDLFSFGTNAVFGQEHCIKHIVDVIESFDNEASLNRGIVLVGPPASGKTNIVDLIVRALEEYTKQIDTRLYTFYFKFKGASGRSVEIRPRFHHNPILLVPITSRQEDGKLSQPRKILFEKIKTELEEEFIIPNFYLNATLDKRTLDILEALALNPVNKDKSFYDILDEYVRIEEIEFSTAQAKGISNIDDTAQLQTRVTPQIMEGRNMAMLNQHMPGFVHYQYNGAIVDSNRGILHIHDAFGLDDGSRERDYKPLLMLLGSGKVSIESTQASVDNTVVITTNIEEMKNLDKKLDASKLIDRIERVPVNYLLDANSEMDILRRDMSNLREQYDLDPNLLRIAAYYSVLTRLMAPEKKSLPEKWSDQKKSFYKSITPAQKLFIYAAQNDDPIGAIQELPNWHPFHNEMVRLGLNSFNTESFAKYIVPHPRAMNLRDSGLFTNDQLGMLDNEFMRILWNEHFPMEGIEGISVRQLQNIMRNTIAHSDGRKIHVGIFLKQLEKILSEGPELHHWLVFGEPGINNPIQSPTTVYASQADQAKAGFGNYQGLVNVIRDLYFSILKKEITVCTVDRNPERIEYDLRKYVQHALLNSAIKNKSFAHIMVPRFTFVDPQTGVKVEIPDTEYMKSIEAILSSTTASVVIREQIARKFLDAQEAGDIVLEENKPVIASREDSFLQCFAMEYSLLLSHRKVDEDVNPEQLTNAFFLKRNNPERLNQFSDKIRLLVTSIISNMSRLYSYSEELALDTIVFAIRKNIVRLEDILR